MRAPRLIKLENLSKASSDNSKKMRAVRRANTKPELIVRKVLHAQGLRFRIHQKSLPGSPDIVLTRHRTVIFVHGCFWHRHQDCRYASTPKTRQDFWQAKFQSNITRDKTKEAQLVELGWRVIIVWECETRKLDILENQLKLYFGSEARLPRSS
ncbi:very short patch repair endonuclease [Pseudomonas atacamensis]|uniref:very short patch repair endonuclease n=1 Tax=Pseudomonas atacamensis TaxID=2565368 RepID=UPI002B46997D|nr:very short patch repair endonuclease [Pseudomonas atacamensis]MEB2855529.1 very short patch repair endonuclease [Pseudomonas atacamensis]